jgi:hypothetical protein
MFSNDFFQRKGVPFFCSSSQKFFICCCCSSNETKTSKNKHRQKERKKRKLIPITSIESSHVVAEEKKTVVVVVVDRLKNRLDSRRPRGGAARDVARGKRRGEYCLRSLAPPSFFLVCVCPIVFLFVSFSAALERCDERERETNERCSDRRRKMTMI